MDDDTKLLDEFSEYYYTDCLTDVSCDEDIDDNYTHEETRQYIDRDYFANPDNYRFHFATPYDLRDDWSDPFNTIEYGSNLSEVFDWLTGQGIRFSYFENDDLTVLPDGSRHRGSDSDGFIDLCFMSETDLIHFALRWRGNMVSHRGYRL